MRTPLLALLAVAACGEAPLASPPQPPPLAPADTAASAAASSSSNAGDGGAAAAPAPPPAQLSAKPVPLPGATAAVSLDYIACDRAGGKVWIPAGDTQSVAVYDIATAKMTRIEGFPTAEREVHGKKRVLGASSATLGAGVVYIGNRGNSQVCAIDAVKLTRGACITLSSPPDGLQYVASAKELWATTPRDNSITVLDASAPGALKQKTKVSLEGAPEGFAIDDGRGLFYTNLEDKDKTLAIDVRTHKVATTWEAQCGSDGPRGMFIDSSKRFLFVACTDHIEALDAGHDGALLSKLDTGGGVDNIDYLDTKGLLYVAAGKAAQLTVVRVDDKGILSVLASGPTSQGARNAVADRDGNAYVADGAQGRILIVPSP
jgi:DNA-binding beta-propeller fold protein YncE